MVDELSKNRKKCGHVSDTQKSMLITFMENDPQLRSGKFTNNFSYKESQQRWKFIAEQLNSSPGTKKDWSPWRRTWQDLKRNTRKKSADLNKYKTGTGGGPAPKELNDNEANILNVLDTSTINGNELVDESIIITDHDYVTENLGNEQIPIIREPCFSNVDEMLPEDSTKNSVPNTSSAKNPKRRRMATTRLSESINASQNIQQMLNNRNKNDEMYRVEKLALLQADIVVKERKAVALETLADKLC